MLMIGFFFFFFFFFFFAFNLVKFGPFLCARALADPLSVYTMVFVLLYRILYCCSYKGIGPTLVSGAPYTGIQMTVYELMQVSLSEYHSLFV